MKGAIKISPRTTNGVLYYPNMAMNFENFVLYLSGKKANKKNNNIKRN